MFWAVVFVLPETRKGFNPLWVTGFTQFAGSSHSLNFDKLRDQLFLNSEPCFEDVENYRGSETSPNIFHYYLFLAQTSV